MGNRGLFLPALLLSLASCSGNVNNNSPVLLVTQLESTDSLDQPGNGNSLHPGVTPDGRYIVFVSNATNLVPGMGVNLNLQVYRKDTFTREIVPVSTNTAGSYANGESDHPSISDDGRYVAFESKATDLVDGFVDSNDASTLPNTPPWNADVFLRDLETETTILISSKYGEPLTGAGSSGEESGNPMISGDGRFVVFESKAENLASQNISPDPLTHIWLLQWKEATSVTNPINVDRKQEGTIGDKDSRNPAISRTARFVVFETAASNLTNDLNDLNTATAVSALDIIRWDQDPDGDQVFLEDEFTNQDGYPWGGPGDGSLEVHIRYLSPYFVPTNNLAVDPTDADCLNPSVAEDGVVAFESFSNELDERTASPPPTSQIYLYEPSMGNQYEIGSLNQSNIPGKNGDSTNPVISSNGRYVAFLSRASNLTSLATGNFPQVFLHDRSAFKTSLMSLPTGGKSGGNSHQQDPVVTDLGGVVFSSDSSNLVFGDENFATDIYSRKLDTKP